MGVLVRLTGGGRPYANIGSGIWASGVAALVRRPWGQTASSSVTRLHGLEGIRNGQSVELSVGGVVMATFRVLARKAIALRGVGPLWPTSGLIEVAAAVGRAGGVIARVQGCRAGRGARVRRPVAARIRISRHRGLPS